MVNETDLNQSIERERETDRERRVRELWVKCEPWKMPVGGVINVLFIFFFFFNWIGFLFFILKLNNFY